MSVVNELDKLPLEKKQGHPLFKLYIAVFDVLKKIQENPERREYWLGESLGKIGKNWRRAKKRLPQRYRLFFKYFGSQRSIFAAWLNDENTLRKKGKKTDCYKIFRRMLERGDVPDDYDSLLAKSISPKEPEK